MKLYYDVNNLKPLSQEANTSAFQFLTLKHLFLQETVY